MFSLTKNSLMGGIIAVCMMLVEVSVPRDPFRDEPHTHVETPVIIAQAPVRVAAGNRVDGVAKPEGVRATVSVNMPVAVVSLFVP
jgi:hypothetical protein